MIIYTAGEFSTSVKVLQNYMELFMDVCLSLSEYCIFVHSLLSLSISRLKLP